MVNGLIFLAGEFSTKIISIAISKASAVKGKIYLSKGTNLDWDLLAVLALHRGTSSQGGPQSARFPLNDKAVKFTKLPLLGISP